MAHHLYHYSAASLKEPQLRLLAAFEDGHVTLFIRTDTFRSRSVEGVGWDMLWSVKVHVESGS